MRSQDMLKLGKVSTRQAVRLLVREWTELGGFGTLSLR